LRRRGRPLRRERRPRQRKPPHGGHATPPGAGPEPRRQGCAGAVPEPRWECSSSPKTTSSVVGCGLDVLHFFTTAHASNQWTRGHRRSSMTTRQPPRRARAAASTRPASTRRCAGSSSGATRRSTVLEASGHKTEGDEGNKVFSRVALGGVAALACSRGVPRQQKWQKHRRFTVCDGKSVGARVKLANEEVSCKYLNISK
jgi:hypothetical protein